MNRRTYRPLKESRQLKRRKQKDYRPLKVVSFFAVLFLIGGLSLVIPLRPTESASEKRELEKFPSFSAEALFSGSYFDDIDTWFSDTFPFREEIVAAKGFLENWQGIRSVQVHGDVGNTDEIPDVPMSEPVSEESSAPSSEPVQEPSSEPVSEESSEPEESSEEEKDLGDTQTFGGILQVGDSAYEYYNFNLEVSNRYITAINKAAANLDGVAQVYDMIVPNSMGITAPDSVTAGINVSDQKQAIDYMYSSMSEKVKTVELYDLLRSHRKEYIYFRTDHHWTARGAYYGYSAFLKEKGLTARPLEDYEENAIEGFLGTFYSSTGKSSVMGSNPDTVYTYNAGLDTSMTITEKSGKSYAWPLINDTSSYPADLKYCTFIGGDYPYTLITNNGLSDNSSCVVIKESYGNALIPFLAENYQTIHVIDYRYWQGSLSSFVKENGVKDVLFINNISATRSSSLVGCIEDIQ